MSVCAHACMFVYVCVYACVRSANGRTHLLLFGEDQVESALVLKANNRDTHAHKPYSYRPQVQAAHLSPLGSSHQAQTN